MKYGYPKLLYHQERNKDETIISVIKRLFGEHATSRSVKIQNRELSFRYIAYNNMHRLTNLVIIVMVSTWPIERYIPILLGGYMRGLNRTIIGLKAGNIRVAKSMQNSLNRTMIGLKARTAMVNVSVTLNTIGNTKREIKAAAVVL
jgi:hypothetical protein